MSWGGNPDASLNPMDEDRRVSQHQGRGYPEVSCNVDVANEKHGTSIPVGGSSESPEAVISCNYAPGPPGSTAPLSGPPKFKISHCQRKICKYPTQLHDGRLTGNQDGYRYIGRGGLGGSEPSCSDGISTDQESCDAAGNVWDAGRGTDSINNVLGYEYGSLSSDQGEYSLLYGTSLDTNDQSIEGAWEKAPGIPDTDDGPRGIDGSFNDKNKYFRPAVSHAPYSNVNQVTGINIPSANKIFGGEQATDTLTTNAGICVNETTRVPNMTHTDEASCSGAGLVWEPASTNYINKSGGSSIQCDNRNWYGKPIVDCNQTSDNYLDQSSPDFGIRGCYQNKCIMPNKNLTPGTPGRLAYDNLLNEEKEKWDRVARGYQFPDNTIQSDGLPKETSVLRNSSDNDPARTSDLSTFNITCKPNFRKQTDYPKIICPSYLANGLIPQYDQSGEIPIPSINDPGALTERTDAKFGFFTNIISDKKIYAGGQIRDPTAAETELVPERIVNGKVVADLTEHIASDARHQGVPGENIDTPYCIENKCTLDKVTACSSKDYVDGLCDNKLETREGGAANYQGIMNTMPELPGYVFNFYNPRGTDPTDLDRAGVPGFDQIHTDVKLLHSWDGNTESVPAAGLHKYSNGVPVETGGNSTGVDLTGSVSVPQPRQAYHQKIQAAIDIPHTVHQLGGGEGKIGPGLTCAPNYHQINTDGPKITCGGGGAAEGGALRRDGSGPDQNDDGKFVLSGCNENYCTLPDENEENTGKYIYTTDNRSNLQNLQAAQNGSLTLRQFNASSGENNNTLKCASYTRPIGETCMKRLKPDNLESAERPKGTYDEYSSVEGRLPAFTDRASCESAGSCIAPHPDLIANDDSIQNAEDVTTLAQCNSLRGKWVTDNEWINFDGPRVTCPKDGGTFIFEGCDPPDATEVPAAGTFYYASYPGDCVGTFTDSLSWISQRNPDGPITATGPNASPTGEPANDIQMYQFMKKCETNCNNNNYCSGFSVRKLPGGTGALICDARTGSGEGGTIPQADGSTISVQGTPYERCIKSEPRQNDWAANWGYDQLYKEATFDSVIRTNQLGECNDANSASCPSRIQDVLRIGAIPDDQSIFFEKTLTPGAGGR